MEFGNVALWNWQQSARIRINQGGTWSGKTWAILHNILAKVWHDEKATTNSVVGYTVPHLKKGALKDWKDILVMEGVIDAFVENKSDMTFTCKKNGAVIEFFSADNEAKLRGGKRDRLFVNEANLLTWLEFSQLEMRTRDEIYLDYNPTGEFWAHEKLKGQPNAAFNISTFNDNPSLPDSIRESLARMKVNDPDLYRIYGEGLVGQPKGLIYPNAKMEREFPDETKFLGFGLDFGFTNDPTALTMNGVQNGEIWTEQVIYDTGLTNQDLAAAMRDFGIDKSYTIIADCAEPKSIEELKREGFNVVPAAKGADSVSFGISIMKQYKWNIVGAQVWKEAARYCWDMKRDALTQQPAPRQADHAMDATRYWAMHFLGHQAPKKRGLGHYISLNT